MGYEGHGPIRLRKEGIIEPIQPPTLTAQDTTGLGYRGKAKTTGKERNKGKQKEIASTNLVEQIHKLQAWSEIDSNEYEWDSLSELSCDEKDIDIVQQYTSTQTACEGQGSPSRPLEFNLHNNNSEFHEE